MQQAIFHTPCKGKAGGQDCWRPTTPRYNALFRAQMCYTFSSSIAIIIMFSCHKKETSTWHTQLEKGGHLHHEQSAKAEIEDVARVPRAEQQRGAPTRTGTMPRAAPAYTMREVRTRSRVMNRSSRLWSMQLLPVTCPVSYQHSAPPLPVG
jgi:hypothetical protein